MFLYYIVYFVRMWCVIVCSIYVYVLNVIIYAHACIQTIYFSNYVPTKPYNYLSIALSMSISTSLYNYIAHEGIFNH